VNAVTKSAATTPMPPARTDIRGAVKFLCRDPHRFRRTGRANGRRERDQRQGRGEIETQGCWKHRRLLRHCMPPMTPECSPWRQPQLPRELPALIARIVADSVTKSRITAAIGREGINGRFVDRTVCDATERASGRGAATIGVMSPACGTDICRGDFRIALPRRHWNESGRSFAGARNRWREERRQRRR
jgi:hypothetical protein